MTDLLDRVEIGGEAFSAPALWNGAVLADRGRTSGVAQGDARERRSPVLDTLTEPASQTRRFTLTAERGHIAFEIVVEAAGTLPPWWWPLLERLQELLDLPVGWNSYGARRVTGEAVIASLRLVDTVTSANTPAPSVVPTVRGGLQLEWHTIGRDLELSVSPEGRYSAFYSNDETGEEWERDFTYPPARLRLILDSISNP